MPDTRPGLILDEEGICQGCRYYESLHTIDWSAREAEIQSISTWAKERSSMGYDAIVAVSGGKDSTRQAMYARDHLGLNVLLVSTMYPPEMSTDIGVGNLENLTRLGFDTISLTPDPNVYKKLMKKGFFEYGNFAKSTETVLYTAVHQVAAAYGIPLILLGENGSIVYGDTASQEDGGNAENLRYLNTIGGGDVSYLYDEKEKISKKNILMYNFPEVAKDTLKVVYLGYYIRDFSQIVNGLFSMAFGLQYRNNVRLDEIGTLYNFSQSDMNFTQVNQLIKYYKFGFGKATEDISELIKLGVMTRETGIAIAEQIDGKCDHRYIQEFCTYLEISEKEFWETAESYRNLDIWKLRNGKWELRSELFVQRHGES